MATEKKSIIKDAITDYKQIQEAAEKVAKDKLSSEFPNEFKKLVKEELGNNNNNKKSAKESYKKLDESDDKNTKSTMKDKKETKKKVNEDERNQDFMGDVENDTPNKENETDGDGVAYKEKSSKESVANKTEEKGGSSEKSISVEKESKEGVEKVNEEFDVSDLDLPDTEDALDAAGPDDEVVTMDEIEKEISEMEQLKDELEEDVNDPFSDKVGKMRDQLQEMLNSIDQMQEQKKHGGKQNYKGREDGGPTQSMIDEEEVEEQKKHGGKQNYKGREDGGPTQSMIDEDDMITDDDIEAVINDDEIDEAQGGSLSSNKHVAGDHLPGKGYSDYKNDKKRYGSVNRQNENAKKKVNALIQENKKLTKKINESKKYKETVTKLVENYKSALDKYRTQLKDMAVYNTNLSHVNNLLVNEDLALTQKDKIKIIKEFKSIESIKDSQKKYKDVLNEMKEGKKTISESKEIEDKLNESVGESSKKQLDEISEKTAYKNNEHIQKIKNMVEYIERNDKKNNLNS